MNTIERRRFRKLCLALAAFPAFFLSSPASAQLFWDNNGTSAGFGTAGGTWTDPTVNQWSTDATGVAAPGASFTTAGTDIVNFGTDALALGTGTITVSGTVAASQLLFGKASGAITLSGGTIDMSGVALAQILASSAAGATLSTQTIDSNISKTNAGTLRFGRQNTTGENYIVNGVLSGNFALDLRPLNNGAFVAFNGVNTFTGNVNAVTGQTNFNSIADIGVDSALGAGSTITVAGGGGQQPTLWFTGTSAASTDRIVNLNGGANRLVSQDAPLTLAGNVTGTSGSFTSVLNLSGDGGGTTANEISSVIGGNVRVDVISFAPVGGSAEAGFWKLSGDNTYDGTTTVTAGTLVVGHNNALGTTVGSTTVGGGGLLHLDGGAGNLTIPEAISFGGTSNGALRTLAGDNVLTGLVTLTSNLDVRSNGSATIAFNGGITGTNRNLGLNGRYFINNNPVNLGTGQLNFTSNGTDVANASEINVAGNTWGETRISFSGYAKMGAVDALPSTTNVVFGHDAVENRNRGTLDLNGFNQTVGSFETNADAFGNVSGSGVQTLTDSSGSGVLTVNQSTDTEFQGRITGGVGLTKTGSGKLTLNNQSGQADDFTGNTTVSGGTLAVQGVNSLATSGVVTVGAGASLDVTATSSTWSLGSTQTLTGSGTILGSAAVAGIHSPGSSPGIQTFSSDLTYNGGANVIWELIGNSASPGDRGTVFDGIDVGGNLDFSGATTVTLSFNGGGSTVDWSDVLWGTNQSWLLYDVAGSTTNLSNFNISTDNWADAQGDLFNTALAGSSFNLSQSGSDVFLNYDTGIIPEPSRFMLLGLGAMMALMVRRRV